MPALNFKPQFIPYILNNTKPHTIRQVRKHPIAVGQDLRLYTGMRTKACTLLRDWTPCLGVQEITITFGEGIRIDGRHLSSTEAREFIFNDGFRSGDSVAPTEFWQWFCKGFELGQSFHGVLISWAPHAFLSKGKKE